MPDKCTGAPYDEFEAEETVRISPRNTVLFLSSEVSFLERLAGGRHFLSSSCVYRQGLSSSQKRGFCIKGQHHRQTGGQRRLKSLSNSHSLKWQWYKVLDWKQVAEAGTRRHGPGGQEALERRLVAVMSFTISIRCQFQPPLCSCLTPRPIKDTSAKTRSTTLTGF
ncbi:hypothetical protein Q8A73_023703 [Channa argus]|nr:hypothetical protein Q8A73_023703 [Channa argus]